jgi:hypothetical protein
MTTATTTWPTLDALEAVVRQLDDAIEAIDLLSGRMHRLVDSDVSSSLRDGAP